jgi:hypothetical protein
MALDLPAGDYVVFTTASTSSDGIPEYCELLSHSNLTVVQHLVGPGSWTGLVSVDTGGGSIETDCVGSITISPSSSVREIITATPTVLTEEHQRAQ